MARQMSVQRLTLLPDVMSSLRQGSAVAQIGLGNLQMQLQRNGQGAFGPFPNSPGNRRRGCV